MWTIPVTLFLRHTICHITYILLFNYFLHICSSHISSTLLPPLCLPPHEDQTGSLDFEASWLIVFLSRHQGLSDRAAHHRSRLTEHPSSLGDQLPPPCCKLPECRFSLLLFKQTLGLNSWGARVHPLRRRRHWGMKRKMEREKEERKRAERSYI